MFLLDEATRIKTISDAVTKVANADLGSFCNIKEKDGKLMVVVENSGNPGAVVVTIQGELDDNQLQKAVDIVKGYGGDELQLSATLEIQKAVEFVNKVFVELTGNADVDIEVELALE